MSILPHDFDLVEEILCRIPSSSLSRFRSTCKRWDALFKDQRFIKKQSAKAPKQFLDLMLRNGRVSSVSIGNNNINAPLIEFKGELSLKDSSSSTTSEQVDISVRVSSVSINPHGNLDLQDSSPSSSSVASSTTSEQVNISKVFYCEGFLLCHTNNKNRVVVWNPCTGETKCLTMPNREGKLTFALGYENNNSSSGRNYKLLRYRIDQHLANTFDIYEFSTGSWRILNLTDNNILADSIGVSLKGDTYWINHGGISSIIKFDFSTERVERLDLPFQTVHHPWCIPSFGAKRETVALTTLREEKLLVIHQKTSKLKMDIWVTKIDDDDDKQVLDWTKLFSLDTTRHFFPSLSNFVVFEDKKVVCCQRSGGRDRTIFSLIGDGVYRKETISGRFAFLFKYAPSLATIPKEEN